MKSNDRRDDVEQSSLRFYYRCRGRIGGRSCDTVRSFLPVTVRENGSHRFYCPICMMRYRPAFGAVMQFRVRNNDGIAMAVVAQVGASCEVDARLDRMIADGLISFESLQAVLMPTAPFQSGFHFARIKEIDTDYGAGFEPAGASFLVGPDYDAGFEQRISIDALPHVDWMQLRELCELKKVDNE